MTQGDEHGEFRRLLHDLSEAVGEFRETTIESFGEMRAELADIKATCRPCREAVGRVMGTIDGNGKDGLVLRVDRVERRVSAVEKAGAEEQEEKRAARGSITMWKVCLVGVAGGIAASVVQVFPWATVVHKLLGWV